MVVAISQEGVTYAQRVINPNMRAPPLQAKVYANAAGNVNNNVNVRPKSIEEQAVESTSRGNAWIERFRQRSRAIVADLMADRTISDTELFVTVYVRGQGYIKLPLHVLLTDPDWINDANENSRMQCEVLHDTFMPAVIYTFLQQEAVAAGGKKKSEGDA